VGKLPSNITVDFIKGVNHFELDGLHKESHAFISPSKNENYGHSIVEALGHGCPIIISDKTPWKKLAAKNVGFDLPLDKNVFVDAINKLCAMDAQEFLEMRIEARKEAVTIFNSDQIKKRYTQLFP